LVRRLLAILAFPLLLVSACGGAGGEGGDNEQSTGGGAGGDLSGVSVSGGEGKAPQVDVEQGFSVDETTTEVVAQGEGPEVARGATVLVNYVAVNAKNGQTFDNTYESGQAQTFTLAEQQMFPGIIDALVGHNAGDRVTAAIPPSALFGQQGNPQVQVGPNDTVVFVFDIEQASDPDPLQQVEPGSQELPPELPQLTLDDQGTPTGFEARPSTEAAPQQLQVETLVEGDGDTVESGDLLTVHYLGQIYPDGDVFDQSYQRGEPTTFQIGVGGLIPAWDEALVGLKEGSRVVLVVPPAQGYGQQGNPGAGIKGTDTLIFVVDVLGVS
jgi:peptidylprolyl isomerase